MKITLENEKKFTINKPLEISTNEIEIHNVIDLIKDKKVVAYISIGKEFVNLDLWENEQYGAIGQWTDSDVIDRVNQLLNL